MKNILFENASFLNEKTTFFQRLFGTKSNNQLKSKPKTGTVYITRDDTDITNHPSEEILKSIDEVLLPLKKKVYDLVNKNIKQLPSKYNGSITALESSYGTKNANFMFSYYHSDDDNLTVKVSADNPGILLCNLFFFDGKKVIKNTPDIDHDYDDIYDWDVELTKSITDQVIKLFDSTKLKGYIHRYTDGWKWEWSDGLYITLYDAKKVLGIE